MSENAYSSIVEGERESTECSVSSNQRDRNSTAIIVALAAFGLVLIGVHTSNSQNSARVPVPSLSAKATLVDCPTVTTSHFCKRLWGKPDLFAKSPECQFCNGFNEGKVRCARFLYSETCKSGIAHLGNRALCKKCYGDIYLPCETYSKSRLCNNDPRWKVCARCKAHPKGYAPCAPLIENVALCKKASWLCEQCLKQSRI